MKNSLKSKLTLCFSMTIFGTIGLFTRNIAVSSGEIALYRAVLAAVLLISYMAISRQKVDYAKMKGDLPLLFISGIVMGFNWILMFQSYKYTTVSVTTLCYYFAPVIVTVACTFLFKEKLNKKQIFCFIMSTVGLVLIVVSGDMSGGSQTIIGILYGIGAAVLYATVVLLNKSMKRAEGIPRTLFQFIAAIVVLIPYVTFTSGFQLELLDGKGWICMLVLGLFHTGVTYCLYFNSLKELSGQEASILSYIDPLVAVCVSVMILGESMTLLQAIGGFFILGFTLLNERVGRE